MSNAVGAKERLAFLDVARGLAALLVLAQHGIETCLPEFLRSSYGPGFVGRAGVILFLIISGFIIPASLEQGGSSTRFWLRRFFRLFPAYWLSIALGLAYYLCTGQHGGNALAGPGDWLLNLTMLQGFFKRPHVWGLYWKLQLELLIYAVSWLLYTLRLLGRSQQIMLLVLGVYLLLGVGRPLLMHQPFDVGGQRLLYCAPLLGLIAQRLWSGQTTRALSIAIMAGHLGVMLVIWAVNHRRFPGVITATFLGEWLRTWAVALTCFLSLMVMPNRAMPSLGCWLGRISYSIYLMHPLGLAILPRLHLPPWAFVPALLAGTLLLAHFGYRFVERPGIALGRLVERHFLGETSARRKSDVVSLRPAA